jgi:hypothetical protein
MLDALLRAERGGAAGGVLTIASDLAGSRARLAEKGISTHQKQTLALDDSTMVVLGDPPHSCP